MRYSKLYIGISVTACITNFTAADMLTIKNKTDEIWHAAVYYVDREGKQSGPIITIGTNEKKEIERPERKIKSIIGPQFYDRNIYFTSDIRDLKENLREHELQSLKGINIGTLKKVFNIKGKDILYLAYRDDGSLGIFNTTEWLTRPATKVVTAALDSAADLILSPLRKTFNESEYAKKEATVTSRHGSLSSEEKDYISKRKNIVKNAIEHLIGEKISDKQVPCIAVCCSGGGYRAMVATTGNLIGLDEVGLLDAITYAVGLSGSTWAISGWFTSGLPITAYRDQLSKRIDKDLFHGDIDSTQIATALLKKKVFGQPISIVDIYGALLGQKILKGLDDSTDPNNTFLINQTSRIADGTWPLPIYTAVIAPDSRRDPYEWIEFTPYEVGSEYLRTYVPSWAAGQHFVNGRSTQKAPPQSLGYFMGIWGSAISANFSEMLTEYESKLSMTVRALLRGAMAYGTIGETRILPAHLWNFTYHMKDKPLQQKEKLAIVDAGVDFNNPLPPLLRSERNVDIIIVFDQSAKIDASNLKKAAEYFKKRGVEFASIDYSIAPRTISIHTTPAGKAPVILYMPRVGNDANHPDYEAITKKIDKWAFTDTSNFAYTPEQVVMLSERTKDNVIRSKEAIIKVIKEVVAQKA